MSNSLDYLVDILNNQRNVDFKKTDGNKYSSLVQILDGHYVEILISFPDRFPLTLPLFWIKDEKSDVFRVHVDPKGKICLFDHASMLFDVEHPEQILIDCYDQAIRILTMPLDSEVFQQEMTREFNAYWSTYAKWPMYWASKMPQLKYFTSSALCIDNHCVLAASTDDARFLLSNYMRCAENSPETVIPCTIVSLRKGSCPIRIRKDYKWAEVRKYVLNNTSASAKQGFKDFLKKRLSGKKTYLFIFICPTDIGEIIWGFDMTFNAARNETIEHCDSTIITPVLVRRIDRDYLLLRSGGNTNNFDAKKILLLGCGSVGGFVAANLCQIGIGTIDLLDKDDFSTENTYRHFLGFDSAFSSNPGKSEVLKARLEAMYPYVEIDSLNYQDRSVESYIQDTERLANYDLIISALGEPTINLEINRILSENKITVPFICCFNEPYGIGGHVIAVNIENSSCLRCLYTKVDNSELCSYRASLVAPDQNFKKNISGCSGAFVPYSTLDSQQTAIITTRAASRVLLQEEKHNFLEYWSSDGLALKKAGFITSPLFDTQDGKPVFNRLDDISNCFCPICRKVKEGDVSK